MTFSVMLLPAMSFFEIAAHIFEHFAAQFEYVSASLFIFEITEGCIESKGFRERELN